MHVHAVILLLVARSTGSDGWHFTARQTLFPALMKLNGCRQQASHYRTAYDGEIGLYCVQEGECSGARHAAVVRCAVDAPHGWPVGVNTTDFTIKVIWSFFDTHRKGAGGVRAHQH